MRKLSKRERILMILFFYILIVVIGIQWIVYPSLDKIKFLNNERSDLQLQWDEIKSYSETKEYLSSQIVELTKKTEELDKQLPSVQSSHLYWESINKSAKQSGVKIVQIQEDIPDNKTAKRLVHLSFTGGFSQTLAFIKALNTMPYINAISEGAFQRGEQLTTSLIIYISAKQTTNVSQVTDKPVNPKDVLTRDPFK